MSIDNPTVAVVVVIGVSVSAVGGAGADPPTSKMGKFFLMALALSVIIFN